MELLNFRGTELEVPQYVPINCDELAEPSNTYMNMMVKLSVCTMYACKYAVGRKLSILLKIRIYRKIPK